MLNFIYNLLDFIYKKKCYLCHSSKENKILCDECYDKIEFVEPKKFYKHFNFYTCCIYEKEIKTLIRGIKYHNQKDLAYYLAKIMYEQWQKLGIKDTNLVLVPVPQYKKHKRKYNHMELIAEEFSKLTNIPYDFNFIKRIKETKPQYNLNMEQRFKNLDGAFALMKSIDTNKIYVILDDIITTGSTVKEIIKTLNCDNLIVFSLSSTKLYMEN